mmetsp:Transcript_758/g.2084  ORF Transcript_758/g.2084 Transcript_758/m.2084 type:complete len:232 (+) Transcript_758:1263-1958(+)
MEGTAPSRETANAPAAAAKRMHSSAALPSAIATANAARKQSPAPVSSMATPPGMGRAGWRSTLPSSPTSSEPCAPSVTSTLRAPRSRRLFTAAISCSSVSTGRPVSRANSGLLGESSAHRCRCASLIGRSAPPMSCSTGTPRAAAAEAIASLISSGTSRCSSTVEQPCTSATHSSIGREGQQPFAPSTTTELIVPLGCRKTKPWPDARPACLPQPETSTPCAAIVASSISP